MVMTWRGKGLAAAAVEAGIMSLRRVAASKILPEAQRQVPKDTGLTASSGAVFDVPNGVEISFESLGGDGFPLAVHLHEDFNYRPRVAGTGPKYLEKPFKEHSDEAIKQAREAIKKVLR